MLDKSLTKVQTLIPTPPPPLPVRRCRLADVRSASCDDCGENMNASHDQRPRTREARRRRGEGHAGKGRVSVGAKQEVRSGKIIRRVQTKERRGTVSFGRLSYVIVEIIIVAAYARCLPPALRLLVTPERVRENTPGMEKRGACIRGRACAKGRVDLWSRLFAGVS